jgi:AcrR family transcriptional regulator
MDGSLPIPTLRAQRKAETRQTVLRAAKAAFELKGFCGVDVRTIARSAGLSTGAVYASFPSKAALYEAATGKTAPTPAMMEASPEMLRAAKHAEAVLDGAFLELPDVPSFREARDALREAIAKAEAQP